MGGGGIEEDKGEGVCGVTRKRRKMWVAEGRRGGREEGEVHYDGQRKIIINFIEEIL